MNLDGFPYICLFNRKYNIAVELKSKFTSKKSKRSDYFNKEILDSFSSELMEQSPVSIQMHSPDGKLVASNSAYAKLFAMNKDVLAEVYEKYNILEDEQAVKLGVMPNVKKVFSGEVSFFPEYEYDVIETTNNLDFKNPISGRRWLQTHGFPIKNKSGEVTYAVFMNEDITSRKVAEIALKNARLFTDNLVETANVMIIGLDKDGKINLFNRAAEQITGFTLSELKDKNWFETLVPKDKFHHVHEEFNRIMEGGVPKLFQNPILTKDGEERYITWTNTEIKQDDEPIGLLSFGIDITEQKIAEEALIESEEKFRLLVEQSPYSIQVFNTDGYIDQVNVAFKELWGVDGDALKEVLDNYNVLNDEEARKLGISEAIQQAFKGESIVLPLIEYDAESTLNSAGVEVKANKRWIQARLYPIKNSSGKVVSVVDMEEDMTEVMLKEKKILNYQTKLKALTTELTLSEEKQRKVIATDLHDQVGQLLASSRLQIAALTEKLEKQEILDKLKHISQGLLQGIQATRNAIFELSPPQLNEIGLVAAVSDWTDEELETKHRINVNLTGDNKVFLISDNIRILTFRCIRELLMNVVKHAKATQVDLDIKESKENLAICLNDNGIGFNYSLALLRLKGSGFGLFSIQERIEDIGGTMEIKSEKGKGTSVKLIVPLNV